MSLDVTFRELEPYYTFEVTSPYGALLDTGGTRREGESSSSSGEQQMVSVGAIPCPVVVESAVAPVIEPAVVPNQGRLIPMVVDLRLRGS